LGYNITFKNSVAKDLKRLSKQTARRIIDKIEADLSKNPERFPALTGPFAGMRKYRAGDYRAIFVIIEQDVLVLHVQHRRDVYRKNK